MAALCRALDDPQDRLPPVVHVAGTNGKGSTVAFVRAMAEAAGLRVHAYTSPHLVRFPERIRLAGKLIDDATLNAILDRIEATGLEATVFESTTAAAFLAMAETPADLAVIEVGLGGRLDATNVISRPLITAVAPVDLDHAEFLGTDLAGVAREKAGIFKPGAPAILGRQSEVAHATLLARAEGVGAPVTAMGTDFDAWAERGGMVVQTPERLLDLPAPRLPGSHQIDNAGLAAAIALELGLPDDAIARGIETATWPARMQRLTAGASGRTATAAGAELWLDGGHNPHAAAALAAFLADRQAHDPRPTALIVGMLANKDHAGFFEALRGSAAQVFTVAFDGACAPPDALAAVATGHGLGALAVGQVDAALNRALALGAGRVIICGSLYLAGEVLGADEETWPT
ncbi:MAG: bifunctional folylpolyglutamate synthase/dihydrofolate synthase [Caulobacteraceae bacterium]|nr:bifunctional folylpolyglutamate synthase/dihydrofolate synthase [Caulobacteraceae bacterium]